MNYTDYTPDSAEAPAPVCPVCGEECDDIYRDRDFNIVGCDVCIRRAGAWEEPECFPAPRRECAG